MNLQHMHANHTVPMQSSTGQRTIRQVVQASRPTLIQMQLDAPYLVAPTPPVII